MFTNNMLRPSRRHVHERISQNEADAAGSVNNASINNVDENINDDSIADQHSEASSIIGRGSENDAAVERDLNNFLIDGASAAADGDETTTSRHTSTGDNVDAPETSNSENQNSSRSANNGGSGGGGSSSDEGEDNEEGFVLLQEERERSLRYRRQNTCTLLILFFLLRLWIEAILEKDVGLIFLSMMGTTWTYRWFVTRRDAEEEHDRRIAEENGNNDFVLGRNGLTIPAGDGEGTATTGADAAVNFDPDLGLMSFQAQLALAMLESQRQMIENGGYGGNDRTSTDDGAGVTDEAKEKWKSYEWGDDEEETAKLAGLTRTASMEAIKRTMSAESNYGSVSTMDILEDEDHEERESLQQQSPSSSSPSKKLDSDKGGLLSFDDDEEPSCSICLCGYEPGEKVIRLPCDHVYHASCLESWTENNVRCPLCNHDLMEGFEQPASVRRASRVAEEQRAFRSMALSTLGRRIRMGRRASRNDTRRAAERRLMAAATAATEDSIV
mmetsp:Transcript_17838/g.42938  ORF Transcript_17838/g.42938 Transcript_17838/m.42938 type:complete len:500 (+) Transcript_17838:215-1714(+)